MAGACSCESCLGKACGSIWGRANGRLERPEKQMAGACSWESCLGKACKSIWGPANGRLECKFCFISSFRFCELLRFDELTHVWNSISQWARKSQLKVRTLDTTVSEILKKVTQQRAVTNLQLLGLPQISACDNLSSILYTYDLCMSCLYFNFGKMLEKGVQFGSSGVVSFFIFLLKRLRVAKALHSRVLLFFASPLHQNRKRRRLTQRSGRNWRGCGALDINLLWYAIMFAGAPVEQIQKDQHNKLLNESGEMAPVCSGRSRSWTARSRDPKGTYRVATRRDCSAKWKSHGQWQVDFSIQLLGRWPIIGARHDHSSRRV